MLPPTPSQVLLFTARFGIESSLTSEAKLSETHKPAKLATCEELNKATAWPTLSETHKPAKLATCEELNKATISRELHFFRSADAQQIENNF
ncbi:hypothetical protein NO1_1604 [Candidatus Termititenax aidoneus]|uniref:Uncharacterized protein n=1 Tax=Termititenax aidoneus TaxID=2218524 RepID=A0A388TD28_TERA1|nr:hypothetical protein NO1_1604 [Candidatus Termititenax aidoneus]